MTHTFVARITGLLFAVSGAWAPMALAQSPVDLADLSLESLLNVRVTSASRQEKDLLKTSAAAFIITQEDIRRSGMTEVPELLRMVPGVSVAQINSSTWAISARGFNEQYASKLLVMVDGRSVYDPSSSGVYWHLQNLVIEDIERIEVIRGPGATMWGANAVNGVISITTKEAALTQGGLVVADAGSESPGEGSLRFGGSSGNRVFYRLSARRTNQSSLSTEEGGASGDAWSATDATFRLDWEAAGKGTFMVEGGLSRWIIRSRDNILSSLSPLTYQSMTQDGGDSHVVARWSHSPKAASKMTFQFSYEDRGRGGYGPFDRNTIDFDFQHNFEGGRRHAIVWGASYRGTRDSYEPTVAFSLTPSRMQTHLSTGFLQDEFAIVPQKLYVTVGSKFEQSSFTGFNAQPAVRALWQPTKQQSVWAAAARAIRNANRIQRGMQINVASFPTGPDSFGLVELFGVESIQSEEVLAYETGYRYQANQNFWIDVAGFYNRYDAISTTAAGRPYFDAASAVPHVVQPLYFHDDATGTTSGLELAAHYRITSAWSLKGGYSRLNLQTSDPDNNPTKDSKKGQSPRHQVYLGSHVTLPKSFEWSTHAYVVSSLPAFPVDRYTRLDLGLTWRGIDKVQLSLVGQNLLGPHIEYGRVFFQPSTISRSVHGKVSVTF